MSQDLVIQGAVLSYPHLFQPRQVNNQGEPKYSCNLILPQDFDWAPLQEAIQSAITAKWPQGAPRFTRESWEQVTEGPYVGWWQLKASSKAERPPQVVMGDRQPAGPHQQGEFFPGCNVNAYIRAFGYDTMGAGVSFGLNAIQLLSNAADLPRLDNTKPIDEVFQEVPGAPASTAPVPGGPVQGAPVEQAPV